ncbi:flagellar export chaperone FliS [Paenibacillus marinisediminis]
MNPSLAKSYQAYQKNKYETASPHRLISMLYAGAIKFVNQSIVFLDSGDYKSAHQSLLKAQDIVCELISSLNEREGGEIASNLKNLYLYMIEQMVGANLNKSSETLPVVVEMLQSISSAWNEMGKEMSAGKSYA